MPISSSFYEAALGRAPAAAPWREQWLSRHSSKALRIGKAPGLVRSFENRRRQAGRARSLAQANGDPSCTPALTGTNKVTLAGGFLFRKFSLPSYNRRRS